MEHILNDVGECVGYCPACGPVCKHKDNSLECELCKVDNQCGMQLSVEGPICDLPKGHDEPCA